MRALKQVLFMLCLSLMSLSASTMLCTTSSHWCRFIARCSASYPMSETDLKNNFTMVIWIFSVCTATSLLGAYYLHNDARAIFLNNDLLCNDKCSVAGGCMTFNNFEKFRQFESRCYFYSKSSICPYIEKFLSVKGAENKKYSTDTI